ncbi:MAG: adenylate/guanylate cyclase domain-containing protein [Desulfobacterales bacterium]|nr:adenylate/guanylate cyclase domain-containing protein [Desulfobacterales bacterium]
MNNAPQSPDAGPRGPAAESEGVRKVLLKGIFWRILIIEGILLVWSLGWRIFTDHQATAADLFWYAVRIVILIGVIILFIWFTFRRFLSRKIIEPLEAISEANRRFREDDNGADGIDLPPTAPREIRDIAETRRAMLDTILKVSGERLGLINFIRDTFGRYLSRKVVDRILESPEGTKIGGRRETVTILMSDIRGFTSLSETTDPELMVRLLNRYLDRMSRLILRYDGIIDEIIGDAILAVFGVPERRVDDPHRAVACALAMQNALGDLNREMAAEGHPPLEMGIGINTGDVIVGNIGSEVRMKYGIVGAAVNTASRIESNTIGGQVLIGESTYREVKETVNADPPWAKMMKGIKQPLVVYPVRGIGAPYNVALTRIPEEQEGLQISLPFRCWLVEEGKKISDRFFPGETLSLTDGRITARIDGPLAAFFEVKINFDFCVDAHCFTDIYAKVAEEGTTQEGKGVYTLHLTAIEPGDRRIFQQWIREGAAR